MRISDWSSDVCSSDLARSARLNLHRPTTRNSARHGHSRTCGHFGRGTIFAKAGGWTSCYKRRKHMAEGNYGTRHLMEEEMREKGMGVFENKMAPAPENKRSEEHTSELQSLMRISYTVFCLIKQNHKHEQRYR